MALNSKGSDSSKTDPVWLRLPAMPMPTSVIMGVFVMVATVMVPVTVLRSVVTHASVGALLEVAREQGPNEFIHRAACGRVDCGRRESCERASANTAADHGVHVLLRHESRATTAAVSVVTVVLVVILYDLDLTRTGIQNRECLCRSEVG